MFTDEAPEHATRPDEWVVYDMTAEPPISTVFRDIEPGEPPF